MTCRTAVRFGPRGLFFDCHTDAKAVLSVSRGASLGARPHRTTSQLTRADREIDPAFPVVYMTGAAADDWASRGVPNNVLLSEPFAPAQLVTAVSQLLNTSPPTAPTE